MHALRAVALLAASMVVGSAAPASAQSACTDMGGTVDSGICQGHIANSVYTLDFSFPLGYPDEQAMTDYLTQTRDGFVNVAEMPGSRGLPYELDAVGTTYESGGPEGTRSVVLKIFQNVGGVHPQTWYKAFNYHVGGQAPITWDTLFKPGSKPVDVILPEIQRELQRQTGLVEPILPGDGFDPANYRNFALTDEAVIFFFGQGELLPEAAGAAQASVPRTLLAPMLAI